jgi:hypothetical protein
MQTVPDLNQRATIAIRVAGKASPARRRTTLYDLIEALQNIMPPEADTMVTATAMYLLRSGQITFLRTSALSLPR